MKGNTPNERAKHLQKELHRLYDPHGGRDHVTDMLTDLRHLCDFYGWNFADADRSAYNHYLSEKEGH